MTTAVAQLRGFSAWKQNAYQRLFNYMSPRITIRMKELIFISTITGLIQEVNAPDLKLMKEMNRVFQLARHDDGLAYPVYIKSVIWREYLVEEAAATSSHKVKIREVMSDATTIDQIREVGQYFAQSCPAWLKFADPEYMVEAFVKLVNCVRRHQGLQMVRTAVPSMAY